MWYGKMEQKILNEEKLVLVLVIPGVVNGDVNGKERLFLHPLL